MKQRKNSIGNKIANFFQDEGGRSPHLIALLIGLLAASFQKVKKASPEKKRVVAFFIATVMIVSGFVVITYTREAEAAAGNYVEDFEDDTEGGNPSDDWYTYSENSYGSSEVNTTHARDSKSFYLFYEGDGTNGATRWFNLSSGESFDNLTIYLYLESNHSRCHIKTFTGAGNGITPIHVPSGTNAAGDTFGDYISVYNGTSSSYENTSIEVVFEAWTQLTYDFHWTNETYSITYDNGTGIHSYFCGGFSNTASSIDGFYFEGNNNAGSRANLYVDDIETNATGGEVEKLTWSVLADFQVEDSWSPTMSWNPALFADDVKNNPTFNSSFPYHDMVWDVGDFTRRGSETQYNDYIDYWANLVNGTFFMTTGNHDVTYWKDTGSQQSIPWCDNPQIARERAWDIHSVPRGTYAVMRKDILFISLSEDGGQYVMPTWAREWVETLLERYPDTTTVFSMHGFPIDTSVVRSAWGGSGGYDSYAATDWWMDMLDTNSQIKLFQCGHYHRQDVSIRSSGEDSGGSLNNWGHDIIFAANSQPYNGYSDENKRLVYSIDENGIYVKEWDTSSDSVTNSNVASLSTVTSFNASADDWIAFPVKMQDDQRRVIPNTFLSPNVKLNCIGLSDPELFWNQFEYKNGRWANDAWDYGFIGFEKNTAVDRGSNEDGSYTLNGYPVSPLLYAQVSGATILEFPDLIGHENNGATLVKETMPYAIPSETYNISIQANTTTGSSADIAVQLECTDKSTGNVTSTLSGSSAWPVSGSVGSSYTWVNGTYTVPDNEDAWFMAGGIHFNSSETYRIKNFSIQRQQTPGDDFDVTLSEKTYHASVGNHQVQSFDIAPTDLANSDGNLNVTATINGSRRGIVEFKFTEPVALGRYANFQIDSASNDEYGITLSGEKNRHSSVFRLVPLNEKYSISIDPSGSEKSNNMGNYVEGDSTSGTSYTISYSTEGISSTISLSALTSGRLTWAGNAGETVWCNATGDGNETLNATITPSGTDVLEMRVYLGDTNNSDTSAYINASNITLYVSVDNATWRDFGSFQDGGSNITLNTDTWTWADDPFPVSSTDYIYCRFKLNIPTGQSPDDYYSVSSTSWKVHILG